MQTLLVDRRTLSTTYRDNYSRCACVVRERKREGVEEGWWNCLIKKESEKNRGGKGGMGKYSTNRFIYLPWKSNSKRFVQMWSDAWLPVKTKGQNHHFLCSSSSKIFTFDTPGINLIIFLLTCWQQSPKGGTLYLYIKISMHFGCYCKGQNGIFHKAWFNTPLCMKFIIESHWMDTYWKDTLFH